LDKGTAIAATARRIAPPTIAIETRGGIGKLDTLPAMQNPELRNNVEELAHRATNLWRFL
jgi:hypothetical protein